MNIPISRSGPLVLLAVGNQQVFHPPQLRDLVSGQSQTISCYHLSAACCSAQNCSERSSFSSHCCFNQAKPESFCSAAYPSQRTDNKTHFGATKGCQPCFWAVQWKKEELVLPGRFHSCSSLALRFRYYSCINTCKFRFHSSTVLEKRNCLLDFLKIRC